MKTVVVTGAAGGIGQAICDAFHDEGWRVVGIDLRKPERNCDAYLDIDLEKLARDAAYRAQALARVRAAISDGRLEALVNNAAVQKLGKTEDVTPDDWSSSFAVNVDAPLFLTQGLLAELTAAQGAVVNIASIHANLTKPGFVAYATTKAALVGLTKAMAVDLGGRVRVNAISPAAIGTEMLKAGFRGDEKALGELGAAHPVGRIGEPAEVARLALALAKSDLGFMHGANVEIGGGIHARLNDPE